MDLNLYNSVKSCFPDKSNASEKITSLIKTLFGKIEEKTDGSFIRTGDDPEYEKIIEESFFPLKMSCEEEVIERIAGLYEGVGLWSSPRMQLNVIPPPTSLSIAVAALVARYNENAIWDQYGPSAARSEIMAVAMLADLVGYDKKEAGGIFTFGGTGCNLYAARIGIEKALPDSKYKGLTSPVHVFCSDIAHYSIKSSAIWTGIGLDSIRIIPSGDDNVMDVKALEESMNESLENGAKIGTVFATMGTTDAFGIDPLKAIIDVRDRIQKKAGYRINVHADAVIGWPYLTFKGDRMLGHLPPRLKEQIMSVVSKMADLSLADSIGIDFHKTGWAPYLCSAFLVKKRQDLFLLEKYKKDMPYLYHGGGYQPGIFTLESSRPNYAQKALANILLLGREGYESLIAHLLSVSDHLRARLDSTLDIAILNRHNPAFVTDFRIYPETITSSDGKILFEEELHDGIDSGYTEWINQYNRAIVERMHENARKSGSSVLSYTDSYKTTRNRRMIVAAKSYPMSPFTQKEDMDQLIIDIYKAKTEVDRDMRPWKQPY